MPSSATRDINTNNVNFNISVFPFFTEKDDTLLKGGSGRDPLGLLQIWPPLARVLIPNLSSPVSNLYGIKIVILIYQLYNSIYTSEDSEEISFRTFFRIMEQLLEIFIYQNYNETYCYGVRILAANNYKISSDNSGTIANGLYQFYRGSLRRSDIITNDLLKLTDTYQNWFERKKYHAGLSEDIRKFVEEVRHEGKPGVDPKDLLKKNKTKTLLCNFFDDTSLNEDLKRDLLIKNKEQLFEFIKLYYQISESTKTQAPTKTLIGSCIEKIQQHTKNYKYAPLIVNALNDILLCESFLVVISRIFSWLLTMHNASTTDITIKLESVSDSIQKAGNNFNECQPPENIPSYRFKELQEKVSSAAQNQNMKSFLMELVEYHKKVAKSRKDAPLCFFENDKLIVAEPASKGISIEQQFEQIEDIWDNGYYFNSAYQIYRQLYHSQIG